MVCIQLANAVFEFIIKILEGSVGLHRDLPICLAAKSLKPPTKVQINGNRVQ